jgi:drug/metabolite transporter (DMT)-like permease
MKFQLLSVQTGGENPLPNDRQKRERKAALLQGIVGGMLFGTAAVLIKLLTGFSVFSIALWRLVIASIFLAFLLIVLKKPFVDKMLKNSLPRIVILGLLLGSHFILFVSAALDTTILNATVLVNTTAIWSMFVSSFIFKLKPSRLAIAGILTSFLGVCIITLSDASSQGISPNLIGDLEAVIAAIIESFYLSYGRDIRHKLPILNLMFLVYVFSTLPILVWGLISHASFTLPLELGSALMLIGLGLLPTALAHTLYFSSLSSLKSFETASMALLEPVVATLLGIVGSTILGIAVLGQVPAPIFILGAVLVLGGIFSVAIGK